MSINRIIITGRLTRDPELRQTPSGTAVCVMQIANNRKYRIKDEQRDEVTFVEVTCFGNQATACAESLRKASSIAVDGRLKMDQWEKGGRKITKHCIVAEHVTFMGECRAKETAKTERATEDRPAEQRQETSAEQTDNDGIPF